MPDVILLDVVMPGRSGYAICRDSNRTPRRGTFRFSLSRLGTKRTIFYGDSSPEPRFTSYNRSG
jgi:CheY-like chemotaxis protein